MEIATLEQFLANLEKSDLLSAERLAVIRKSATPGASAQALARAIVKEGFLTRWQAGQLLLGRTEFMLGRYQLLDLLGRGGMGHVFLAEHKTMRRRVALKLVSGKLERDPAAMERFFAEARSAAALDHPNIVRVYSVDDDGDRHYMVLEYIEGKDLQRIVDEQGPLDYATAADAIRQAAEGLAHAHGRNMIHCDIKPANLLVNKEGTVKILDMGLARATGEQRDSSAGAESQMQGTVDYMSPEQALGQQSIDHRADIYSLGCTFYFLLTGKPPFPEGSMAQRIVKHQIEEPPSIFDKRPDAPKLLVKICRKMMAKAPADRYQSAAEVVQALLEWNPKQRELKRAIPLDESPAEESDPLAEILEATTAAKAAGSTVKSNKRGAKASHAVLPAVKPVAEFDAVQKARRQFLILGSAIGTVLALVIAGVMGLVIMLTHKPPHHLETVALATHASEAEKSVSSDALSPTASESGTLAPAETNTSTEWPEVKPTAMLAGTADKGGDAKEAAAKAAAEKEAADKAAHEKAAQEKAAQEKSAAEKQRIEKEKQEKAKQEKALKDKAERDRKAREKADQDKAKAKAAEEDQKLHPAEPIFVYAKTAERVVKILGYTDETTKLERKAPDLNVRDAVTIACQFYSEGPGVKPQVLVAKAAESLLIKTTVEGSHPNFMLYLERGTGELSFSGTFEQGGERKVDSGKREFFGNGWHMVVVTYEKKSKQVRFYTDPAPPKTPPPKGAKPDASLATMPCDGGDLQPNDSPVIIAGGFRGGARSHLGAVRNVKVWARVLSDAEIKGLPKP